MTVARSPIRIEAIDRDGWHDDDYLDGQGLAQCAIGFTAEQFLRTDAEHPGVLAWERMVDEAVAEVGPQVRDLLYDAINKRLPWTWEESR